MNRRDARAWWPHLLMLAGTCIFLFPFLWMIVTSLKTDEELTEGGWWPTVPHFRRSSPYARPPVELHKPAFVTDEQWAAALPVLQQCARAALGNATADQDVRDAAASVLIDRLAPKLGKSQWSSPTGGELEAAFKKLLTPDAVAAAIDDRLARLALLALQIRTRDASIYNIFSAADIAGRWTVETGGSAMLQPHRDASVLRYNFTEPPTPIVLRADFDFPVADPRELHKLILSLRPDDSWHRLDATLEVGGIRWVSTRPTYLAQHRPVSVIFQPPSFDDTTLQAKTWVPLQRKDEGGRMKDEERAADLSAASSVIPHRSFLPRASLPRATLRLTITPSSTAQAAWAKATRNYARVFYSVPFWRYVANSVLLVALTTMGTLFSSTFVAYAFARLRWPGRGLAMTVLLATMMLPAQVTMIPSFMIWRGLGWYNTLNPLWVPAFFGGAFFIFLMTQHMKTLPRELEESARIDGLNAVQTWYYIILPQVKPAAAAIAIMTFMWSWNEFLGPLIYLRDQTRFPLSLGLFGMRLENFGDWSMIMAGNVLMTLPVIVIFFFFQRYFVQGMTMSGLKG
jgi:multiple sugar transport system permease protein